VLMVAVVAVALQWPRVTAGLGKAARGSLQGRGAGAAVTRRTALDRGRGTQVLAAGVVWRTRLSRRPWKSGWRSL
jgi:hypothetical protein